MKSSHWKNLMDRWYDIENRPRCPECNWVVTEQNDLKCLNSKCSRHNKKELERIDYYDKHGEWPEIKPDWEPFKKII